RPRAPASRATRAARRGRGIASTSGLDVRLDADDVLVDHARIRDLDDGAEVHLRLVVAGRPVVVRKRVLDRIVETLVMVDRAIRAVAADELPLAAASMLRHRRSLLARPAEPCTIRRPPRSR